MKNEAKFYQNNPFRAGLIVLVIAGAVIYAGKSSSRAESAVVPGVLTKLPVAEARLRDVSTDLQVPGMFKPYQEADLDAKVRGYVRKMLVDVGAIVKRGQVLAILEVPELNDELNHANASIAVARNQSEKVRSEYEVDKAIYDRLANVMKANPELVAQQEVDQAKARSDGAYAAMIAAQAAIEEAQANLKRIHDMIGYATITAPFSGAITSRFVDEGALVGGDGASSRLFHLSQIDKLRLIMQVPETAVPDLKEGKPATVEVTDLNRSYDLKIARISHQLADQTRTMEVECDLDNGDDAVAAGMYAKVTFPLKAHQGVLTVPVQALHGQTETGQATVYVLQADSTVVARQVQLGLGGTDYTEVTAGLKSGELVSVGVVPRLGGEVKYTGLKQS